MATETGISMYFWDNRISIWKKTLLKLGNPQYIHLRINQSKKHLFIQRCEERDNDAFPIKCSDDLDEMEHCYINAKNLMQYLANLIDVPYPSNSLRFDGRIMEDEITLFVDLNSYQEIPYGEKQQKHEE